MKVMIPKGSLLDPSEGAAVVGGNVLTSQRIVDVVFRAFATCGASNGCMNNITFGSDTWGYYETVAGGAGAVSTTLLLVFLSKEGSRAGRTRQVARSRKRYSHDLI